MTQYAFYFNSVACTGCKTCQVGCKEYYHLPAANLQRRVVNYGGGSWKPTEAGHYVPDGVFSYFMSMACNHCMNPACVENCPTGAMQKDAETGIVWTDHEVCIGCGTCVSACPYEAPQLNEDAGYSIKCDMCRDELTLDRKPVCVMACPMRALDWGERDELVATYGEGQMETEPLPKNATGATTIIDPHPSAQATGSGTGSVITIADEL